MKAKTSSELTRLRGEDWESWVSNPGATAPRLLGAGEVSGAKDKILAIPARQVVALPVWVDSSDPQAVEETLELELEVRGLLVRKKSADVISSRKIVVEERTLVICAVFPAEAPEPQAGSRFQRFEASPFLIDLGKNSLTLWREGRDLVAVFSREQQAVYWATQDWPCDAAKVSRWLELLTLQLVAGGTLAAAPEKIVIDERLRRDELGKLFPGTPEEFSALPPALGHASLTWKPEAIRAREHQASASKKTRTGMLALAGAYLFIVLGAGAFLGWKNFRARQLRHETARLATQTNAFQPAVREWQLVGPGAESDYFPLEILHRVVRHLPEKGVHLTVYDAGAGRITVEGEAVSAVLASQFYNAVAQDKELLALNWQMPTPALLPNNAAHFQLSGVTP